MKKVLSVVNELFGDRSQRGAPTPWTLTEGNACQALGPRRPSHGPPVTIYGDTRDLYKVGVIAQRAGVCNRTVTRAIDKGEIPEASGRTPPRKGAIDGLGHRLFTLDEVIYAVWVLTHGGRRRR